MKKAITSACICFALLFCFAIPTVAEGDILENDESNPMLDFNNKVEEIYQNTVSLKGSAFYQQFESVDMGIFSKLMWEVPTSDVAVNQLNIEYMSAMDKMSQIQQPELTIPKFESGYTNDIVKNFNDLFGDIKADKKDLSLPEGWTATNLMNVAKEKRDEAARKAAENREEQLKAEGITAFKREFLNNAQAIDLNATTVNLENQCDIIIENKYNTENIVLPGEFKFEKFVDTVKTSQKELDLAFDQISDGLNFSNSNIQNNMEEFLAPKKEGGSDTFTEIIGDLLIKGWSNITNTMDTMGTLFVSDIVQANNLMAYSRLAVSEFFDSIKN